MMNDEAVKIGIRQNLRQFVLLVIITSFVGGMVGMERSLIPQLGQKIFHLATRTAVLSFIVAFGISKAVTNYFTGYLANRIGRKRLLVTGWIFALPIPWLLMYAPTWNWIIFANVLLGINQGMAWSSTVMMKLDLAEDRNRGLAMGINEFSGYFAVGLVTFMVAYIAGQYGLRPYPFDTGAVLSVLGLGASMFLVKDTRAHMQEAAKSSGSGGQSKHIFFYTTVLNRSLSAITQAGIVNNMNDGMMWGLYPLLLQAKGFTMAETGVVTAIYPACWGIGQLFTGRLGDRVDKKRLLFGGMFLQALTLAAIPFAASLQVFIILSVLLGLGKALVYPNFLAAVAEHAHPLQRAQSIGIFRFCRDLGYAIGAVLTGVLADALNIPSAILIVAGLTGMSGFLIMGRMREKRV